MLPSRLVVLVVAIALSLLGCSEAVQEAAERSPDPVVAAGARTADAESARVALAVTVPDRPALVSGEGVFDLAEGARGRLTLEVAAGGTPQTLEMRVVDGTVYLRPPAGAGTPTPWVRVDPQDGATPGSGDPLQGLAAQNPAELVGMLEAATDFTEAGTTSVRGAEATLWRGELDLAALADDAAATEQLRSLGLERVPAEVAIDGEGRLRLLSLTVDLSAVAGGTGTSLPAEAPGEVTMRVELFDFGAPVDVEAPPADQVSPAAAAPTA